MNGVKLEIELNCFTLVFCVRDAFGTVLNFHMAKMVSITIIITTWIIILLSRST